MFVANGVTAYISENMEIIIFRTVFIFSLEEEKNHWKHHVCKFYFYSQKIKTVLQKQSPTGPKDPIWMMWEKSMRQVLGRWIYDQNIAKYLYNVTTMHP